MKKEKKTVYGIEITKPWSAEMYAHNEAVAEAVKTKVHALWVEAVTAFQDAEGESFMSDTDWNEASDKMKEIQTAITCYGFGYGYDVARVADIVEQELEDAAFYRLKDIAEELDIKLEKGFVGLK